MISPRFIDQINALRTEELDRVLRDHEGYFRGKDLLEIGSGSGLQLKILSSVCRSAMGLEMSDSWYKERRIADIGEYDGKTIPFPDAAFDVIFSSHVLQYVTSERELYDEMRRVLRSDGIAIHVVPTSTWRFWTSILHYPAMAKRFMRRLIGGPAVSAAGSPKTGTGPQSGWRQVLGGVFLLHRLGARGNWFTEHFIFHSSAWRRRLARCGWTVERMDPVGLWYSGHLLTGPVLSMRNRSRLARIMGSSTIAILAKPARNLSSESGS